VSGEWVPQSDLLAGRGRRHPNAFGAVQRTYRVIKARRHHNGLPDCLLRDIGISQSEINSVTAEGMGDASSLSHEYGHFYR
jgi:uncharacterized protein YjiS (DUF1127 family)